MALEREFEYYKSHKDELDSKYDGQFVIVKDTEIHGPFASQEDALREGLKLYPPGTFLVQHCRVGEDQSLRYFSRVSFPANA